MPPTLKNHADSESPIRSSGGAAVMEIAFSIVLEKFKITAFWVNFGDFDWRQISLFSTPKHNNRHWTV